MAPTSLLAAALALLCMSPIIVSSQVYDNHQAADYTCPTGYLPVADGAAENSPVRCTTDKCYSVTDGCGPGNGCSQKAVLSLIGGDYIVQCQCNPPYVQGFYNGFKGIDSHSICYIPGQDVCNPNPCQNGGTCNPLSGSYGYFSYTPTGAIDFNCTCPFGFLGKSCDFVAGPGDQFPTPVRKNAPPAPPGSQGVCGTGSAADFPTRCYFNSDPQGRYVCCDSAGCNGFNPPDYLFPNCTANGFVPPGFGIGASSPPPVNPPPSTPPASGDQGICGTGTAVDFPVRCWYNNDPQGRYVCCDSAGCDGFNPPDNFFPHCKNSGYVPPTL